MPTTVIPPGESLIKLTLVLQRIPVSRSTWYQGVKEGIYPAGIKLGPRACAWLSSDIDKLISSLQSATSMTTKISQVPGVGTPNGKAVFMGTENLLELTVIATLMHRHISREELDSLAGGGNGLALISDLRDNGLTVNCDRIDFIDNDGNPFSTDVFSFTDRCKRMVNAWLVKRKTGGVA